MFTILVPAQAATIAILLAGYVLSDKSGLPSTIKSPIHAVALGAIVLFLTAAVVNIVVFMLTGVNLMESGPYFHLPN